MFGRDKVFSVGFDTYEGTVTAATKWGEPHQCFALTPALPKSHADVLHGDGRGALRRHARGVKGDILSREPRA